MLDYMPSRCHASTAALLPGGQLLLRDYGRYDEAQLRFRRGHCIGGGGEGARADPDGEAAGNFYVKQDGTRVYYFSRADLHALFGDGAAAAGAADGAAEDAPCGIFARARGAGLRCVECEYIARQYQNRQQRVARYRVWVHAVFEKPGKCD